MLTAVPSPVRKPAAKPVFTNLFFVRQLPIGNENALETKKFNLECKFELCLIKFKVAMLLAVRVKYLINVSELMSEDICAHEAFTLHDQLFLIFGTAHCTVLSIFNTSFCSQLNQSFIVFDER